MTRVTPDIGYIPTPPKIVQTVLALAGINSTDVLYDLGSGDGRIAIAAAQKYGASSVGIDIDPQRIQEAEANAREAGVASLVKFKQGNLFDAKFVEATVVFLYLLPHLNLRLRPLLKQQLQPGARIVSRDFDLGDWPPQQQVRVEAEEETTLYYWQIDRKE